MTSGRPNTPSTAIALLCAWLACHAPAATGAVRFVFEPVNQGEGRGLLDVGPVEARRQHGTLREANVRERISLRLEGDAGTPPTARVSAWLANPMPGVEVRVDGVAVGAFPRVIDANHRIGIAVVHDIEITVPASTPPGPFLEELQWQAETE